MVIGTNYRHASYQGWKMKVPRGFGHIQFCRVCNSVQLTDDQTAVLNESLLLQAVFKGKGGYGLPLQACYVSPELPGLLPQSGFSRPTPSLHTTIHSRSLCSRC
jgi:hypothetical protein